MGSRGEHDGCKTLRDVIIEVPGWKKAGQKVGSEIRAVCSFFQNYYGGKSKGRKEERPDILGAQIKDVINDQGFAAGLLDGVKSYSNDKYILSCRLEKLLNYIKRKYGLASEGISLENFKYRDRNERRLKMLKYLHSGEKSRAQIAEDFGISERVLSGDLKELVDGFEFMGSTIRISELERKRNTYRSIIHPVFLAMNSDEIYAMTVGVKLLSQGTVFEESLGRIADEVYKQLSEYAKEMVDSHTDGDRISFRDDDLQFIGTCDLMVRRQKPFSYFLKEPILCEVTYLEDGKKVRISGTMHLTGGWVPAYDRIVVQSEGEMREIDIKTVSRISRLE